MLLPDVHLEDSFHDERGCSLWVFIADQGFDVDLTGAAGVRLTTPEGDMLDEVPTVYWYDPECYYCGAPLSTSYPMRLLSDPTLRFCSAVCARRHERQMAT